MPPAPTRPLIAVTTSEVRASHAGGVTPEADPPQHEMVLGLKYLRAIERAGGIPLVVPPMAEAALGALLDGVDGLCLSGGPDLDPVAYGEGPHERLGPTWRELDVFELAVTRAADERSMPVLAICRGLQVLNVARGGSLHQHVPDRFIEGIVHRQHERASAATHGLEVAAGSRVEQILGVRETKVNSFHHQAVATLGRDLVATAWAPDGVIECLEAQDREFVLGVQWHAEGMIAEPRQAALFDAFVDAARCFRRAGAELELAA